LWRRLLLVVLGVLVLFPNKLLGMSNGPSALLPFIPLGTVLLLIGVPTFLPWITEGGPPPARWLPSGAVGSDGSSSTVACRSGWSRVLSSRCRPCPGR
jgi:hypothetical protein